MADRSAKDIDRRMALAHEWDELVARAREVPVFEDFLRPPRSQALFAAAAAGPVVIVNVSRWQCDALIVTTSNVDVLELPDLSQENAVDHAQE